MKTFDDFARDLGERESGNRYDCVNTLGFMGRWQFGKPRLYDLGLSIDGWKPKLKEARTIISKSQFLNDHELQDRIFSAHVQDLLKRLNKMYGDRLGKVFRGIEITLSGLVAGAHLLGIGGVKNFFSGTDKMDAYGTNIKEYLTKFAGYNLE